MAAATPTEPQYRGAYVDVDYGGTMFEFYMSFGEYVEERGTDTFGVPDDRIFFYTSREELGAGLPGEDFTVHGFYLVEATTEKEGQ